MFLLLFEIACKIRRPKAGERSELGLLGGGEAFWKGCKFFEKVVNFCLQNYDEQNFLGARA